MYPPIPRIFLYLNTRLKNISIFFHWIIINSLWVFFCLSKRTCWIKNYIHSMVWIDWILRTQPMFMQISSNVRDSKKLFCSKMICNAIVFTWQNCFSMHSKVGFNTEHWIFIYFFLKKAPITYCYSSCFNL